jgi:hypothetical protein
MVLVRSILTLILDVIIALAMRCFEIPSLLSAAEEKMLAPSMPRLDSTTS